MLTAMMNGGKPRSGQFKDKFSEPQLKWGSASRPLIMYLCYRTNVPPKADKCKEAPVFLPWNRGPATEKGGRRGRLIFIMAIQASLGL